MNERLNTFINNLGKFGVPTLAVAGTAVAALAGASSAGVAALPLTIATNLLSNKLTDLTEFELSNRLKNIPPEKLNHDIFRVSKSAVKLALKATIDEYEIDKDTRKKLKKKVDEVCKQLEDNNIWNDITVKDIIDYESNLSETKWSELFADELQETNDILNNANFDTKFQGYFHLYFGEYLKKDHAAFVAYEREIQKMIFNAVNELKSENISETIKESIAQYIKEIPVIAVNSEIQEEFVKELSGLKSYFQPKKIIIREIKSDKLFIEIPPNEIKEIGNSYDELKIIIDDKYYFEYNNRLYSIDELTEETFDYLAGKIKYNQLFTKKIIEAIKNDCEKQHHNFYRVIEQTGTNWDTNPRYCDEGKHIISDSFVGIIGKQLNKLFAIGKETDEQENVTRKKYIEKCQYLVKRTLDLTIFAFISQLWDDVCTQKLKLSDENPLSGHFTMNLKREEQIALLLRLIHIYEEQKMDSSDLLISDILKIANQFDETGELYAACVDLEKLGDNPTALDCYLAEKHLTVFFENFRFLVNYKVASMKKIEYFNIKNIEAGYLHHYVNLGYSRKSLEMEERNFDDCTETVNSLFTNAVLLYKGTDYTKNINLFPFVIDYNALTLEKSSKIAFFRQPAFDEDCLEYAFLDTDEIFDLEHKGIVQQKGNKNVVFLTDEDMKIYNKDCVLTTFRMIEEKLFI